MLAWEDSGPYSACLRAGVKTRALTARLRARLCMSQILHTRRTEPRPLGSGQRYSSHGSYAGDSARVLSRYIPGLALQLHLRTADEGLGTLSLAFRRHTSSC